MQLGIQRSQHFYFQQTFFLQSIPGRGFIPNLPPFSGDYGVMRIPLLFTGLEKG